MKKNIITILFLLIPATTWAAGNTIPNPLGDGVTSINDVYVNVISAVLGILGGLALLFFIYGGLQFMLAAGNEERVSKAKKSLMWATLGIMVVILSYAILQFVYEIILV